MTTAQIYSHGVPWEEALGSKKGQSGGSFCFVLFAFFCH